jgi:hypothetical protein
MTKRWTIRKARIEDAPDVERFLVSVPEYSETLRPTEQRQVWQWLYSRRGEPIQNAFVAQDAEDRIVAHYGLSSLPYILEGQAVDAGVACLLAIDESYRKTPIFLDLTRKVLNEFRERGGTFVTGLANRVSLLEFHKAFGFQDLGEVSVFVKPFRLAKIAQTVLPKHYPILLPFLWLAQRVWLFLLKLLAHESPSGIRLEAIETFDTAIAATSAEIAKHHKFFADRSNPDLLNERFFGLACRHYNVFRIADDGGILGYVALRLMDMKGFFAVGIVDICFDFSRRDVSRAIFRAIDRFALEQGADLVSALTNSAPLISRLRSAFFLKAPENFRLVVLEPAKKRRLGASRIDDWFITWFEHDFV